MPAVPATVTLTGTVKVVAPVTVTVRIPSIDGVESLPLIITFCPLVRL